MKTTKKETINRKVKRFLASTLVVCIITLSFSLVASASDWNQGERNNFVPYQGQQTFNSSSWMQNAVNELGLTWYENPTENTNRWDASVLYKRVIEERDVRLNSYYGFTGSINFNDSNLLSDNAKQEAAKMVSLGVLKGYEDNTLRPNNNILRGEFSKIVTVYNDKVLRKPGIRNAIEFYDTENHWAKNYVSYAYQVGFVNGLGDGRFNPDGYVTKEETVQVACNLVGAYEIIIDDVAKAVKSVYDVTVNNNSNNSNINYNNNNNYYNNNNNNSYTNNNISPTNIYIDRRLVNTTMRVGSMQNLSYQLSPSNATDRGVTYYSSNENAIRVNNRGEIEAINYGSSTITVTTSNNKKDSITITAQNNVNNNNNNNNNEILPTSISIDNINTMNVGDVQTISYRLYPSNAVDKGVGYYCSNTNIIEIDNDGNMKAIRTGTATITITTPNRISISVNFTVGNNSNITTTTVTQTQNNNPVLYVEGYEPQEYYNSFVNESFSIVVENVSSFNVNDIALSNSNVQISGDVQNLGDSKYRFRVKCTAQTQCSTTLTVRGLSLNIMIYPE